MTSPQADESAPTTKGIMWRSIGECTGWAALLGAVYIPARILVFIGLSMRIDSGRWDTIDDPGVFFPALAFLGFIVGVALGVVSGIVVGLMVSSSVRGAATEHRQRVIGALSAAATVALMAGMIGVRRTVTGTHPVFAEWRLKCATSL